MGNLVFLPYMLPGDIYSSAMPFGYFDRRETLMEKYRQAKISTVVMLMGDKEAKERSKRDLRSVYKNEGFDVIHLPIVDFDVPKDLNALQAALTETVRQAEAGKNIVIHCFAGLGRTGMFAGMLSRRVLGLKGEDAVQWIRGHIREAIQTRSQMMLVMGEDK